MNFIPEQFTFLRTKKTLYGVYFNIGAPLGFTNRVFTSNLIWEAESWYKSVEINFAYNWLQHNHVQVNICSLSCFFIMSLTLTLQIFTPLIMFNSIFRTWLIRPFAVCISFQFQGMENLHPSGGTVLLFIKGQVWKFIGVIVEDVWNGLKRGGGGFNIGFRRFILKRDLYVVSSWNN